MSASSPRVSVSSSSSSPLLVKSISFIPPQHKNFGKNAKDLFKKKYDLIHEIKTKHSDSLKRITFESSIVLPSSSSSSSSSSAGPLSGSIKTKFVHIPVAVSSSSSFLDAFNGPYEVEIEAFTDAKKSTKISLAAPKLATGVLAKLTATALGASKASSASSSSPIFLPAFRYGAEVEYQQESFTLQAEVASDLEAQHTAKISSSFGYEGLSLSASADADLSSSSSSSSALPLSDYGVGLEYSTLGKFVTSFWTAKKLNDLNLSFYHKLSPAQAYGLIATFDANGNKTPVVSVGSDVAIDATTSIRAKIDLPSSVTSFAIDHRLQNPSIALNLAALFQPLDFASTGVKAAKFGVGLTVGEY